jgi:hypothetical protein
MFVYPRVTKPRDHSVSIKTPVAGSGSRPMNRLFSGLLEIRKFHRGVQENPPLYPIPRQFDPSFITFYKNHFNIIIPYMPRVEWFHIS